MTAREIKKENERLIKAELLFRDSLNTYSNLYPQSVDSETKKWVVKLLNRLIDNEIDFLHEAPQEYKELYIAEN